MRKFGTDIDNRRFSSTIVEQVWDKGLDAANPRQRTQQTDSFGRLMDYREFGKETPNGWEIDHIKPVAKGGKDTLNNLQALHWKSNREKGDQ